MLDDSNKAVDVSDWVLDVPERVLDVSERVLDFFICISQQHTQQHIQHVAARAIPILAPTDNLLDVIGNVNVYVKVSVVQFAIALLHTIIEQHGLFSQGALLICTVESCVFNIEYELYALKPSAVGSIEQYIPSVEYTLKLSCEGLEIIILCDPIPISHSIVL